MGASAKNGFMAEINVTPFVDVMLVLLVIFMVTAPMMTEGVDVNLPQAKAVETLSLDEGLLLTMKADGSLFLDELRLEPGELAPALKRLAPGNHLYFRADREVPYGRVVEVLGEIKAAGIEKFGVVAEGLAEDRS
ncbi:ExbD/TolR family protein [Desulfovibrio aminophilus]|nr:ExbD/TolR family protein [Desulfovibrio aminophilus]